MLFEDKVRTRVSPKQRGESEFSFYDSSGRPEFATYRALLNGWLGELTPSDRAEMISRFRKGDTAGYEATLVELTIHAALRRRNFDVDVHPACAHPTRKPDFLAKDNQGNAVAYIEVTTFAPSSDDVARGNIEARIYDAIDRAKLPLAWRLGFDVVTAGKATPSITKLVQKVESWAAGQAGSDPSSTPTNVFKAADWEIELTMFGGFRETSPPERSIGIAMGDVRYLSADTKIRQALEKKGGRYGQMTIPYLIVVADCKEELTGGEETADSLLEAVFGEIVTSATFADGELYEVSERRKANGFWGSPGAPKNRNVSGVLLLPRAHLWNLRDERWQPRLVRNPWASYDLPNDLLPLPSYRLTDRDEFELVSGTLLADILGLTQGWPPLGA